MLNVYLFEEESTPLIRQVYDGLEELPGTKIDWISKDEVFTKFKSFQAKCCFIFSYFKGEAFDYLRDLNMTIFGPQLVLDCLRNDEQLPRCSHPVYSTAMKGIIVSFTSLNAAEREELCERFIMMSGTVSGDLTEEVMVLVAGSVGSKKYTVAGEIGLKIMSPSWVTLLWQHSAEQDPLNPWEPTIMKNCVLPILHGLCITVTGLTAQERKRVQYLVELHGAKYMPDLHIGICTHLVAAQACGQKCIYAVKWQIPVISISWITDSIEKGFYQKEEKYKLQLCTTSTESSTPKSGANSRPGSMTSDISLISITKVGETMLGSDDESEQSMNIFSDCVITFAGCDDEYIAKWTHIITERGGTINENGVTHRIVMNPNNVIVTEKNVKHISPEWLQECLDEERHVDENPYIVVGVIESTDIADMQWDTMDSFFSQNNHGIFHGLTVILHESLVEEDRTKVSAMLTEHGGSVASKLIDNAWLVTAEVLSSNVKSTFSSIAVLTVFYVRKCVEAGRLLTSDSDFLFRPVIVTAKLCQILTGCVISYSGYEPDERSALKNICKELGATIQDSMARRPVPQKKILATTHLIISKVDKQKYPSSLSWRIPAVTKQWIGACITAGTKVTTEDHLLQRDQNMTMQSVASDINLNDTMFPFPSIQPKISMTMAPPPPADQDADITMLPPPSPLETPPANVARPQTVNKHLQIRNTPVTPVNKVDQSFGSLDTPIRPLPSLGPAQADMDNFRHILSTPDYCAHIDNVANTDFTTPDIERGLKARLAMLNVARTSKNYDADFSFTEDHPRVSSLPLESVVAYLSKSIGNASQLTLISKIEKLGGSRMWVYESKMVTHVICNIDSVTERNREELERASRDGKFLVTAEWLNQCYNEFRKVDEELYMIDPSNNDKMSINEDELKEITEKKNEDVASEDSEDRSGKRKNSEDDTEKIEERRDSKKRKLSTNENDELMDIGNVVETRPGIRRKMPDEVSWNYGKSDEDTQLEGSESQRAIMFSSVDQEERVRYSRVVEGLGGVIVSGDSIAGITHLVCPSPGRGEKFLAAVAAGKWIVHTSYLEAVATAGGWVDECEYEFGGPRTAEFLKDSSGKCGSQESNLAAAANRWREIGGGAFKEWRVGIVDSADRVEKLGNIIECGGGVMVPMQPSPDPATVTHLLVNRKKCTGKVDLTRYPCYKMELVQYFLTARSLAETKKFTKKLMITQDEIVVLMGQSGSGSRVTRSSRG